MKLLIALTLLCSIVYVQSETCTKPSGCMHTTCDNNHGWWLHCIQGKCECTHDTYTGAACSSGHVNDCISAHGDRCSNVNGSFHCLDNVCHCIRHNIDIGK